MHGIPSLTALDHSYLSIVVLILFGSCLTYAGGNYSYIFGIIRAVRVIHRDLIQSVLGTTLRYAAMPCLPLSRA